MSDFIARMRQAIAHSDQSIRSAARVLQDAGVPGASYSQLRRILESSTQKPPTLDFVEQSAQLLGVQPSWLAFGHGHMVHDCATAVCPSCRKLDRIRDIIEERP